MSHIPPVHTIYEHNTTQTITAGTRAKILCNGLGSRTQQGEAPGMFDVATSRVVPLQQNEIYLLRAEFTAQAAVLPLVQPLITFEWDFGSPQDGTRVFGKDVRTFEITTSSIPILYVTPAFVGATFIQNGASMYLTPRNFNVTLSGMAITVIKFR